MVALWIDADACPAVVKDLVCKAARRLELNVTFVANQTQHIPSGERFHLEVVPAGPDVADQYIAEQAEAGDLVVTQDIPLAAQLVAKQVVVITPYGQVLEAQNIGARLATRDLHQDLRDSGQQLGGPKPFGPKEKERFANSLDKCLTQLKKAEAIQALKVNNNIKNNQKT